MSAFNTGDKVKVFSVYTNNHHSGYTVILDMPHHNAVVVSHQDDNKPHSVGRGSVILDDAPTTVDPYANYAGGKPQYDTDIALLERTALLSKTASFSTEEGIPHIVELGNNCRVVAVALTRLLPLLKAKMETQP